MRGSFIVALLLVSVSARAAQFASVKTGNWNDGGTWGHASPGVAGTDYPSTGDISTIIVPDTVTIPSGYSVNPGSVTLISTGTLARHATLVIVGQLDMSSHTLMGASSNGFSELDINVGGVLNMHGANILLNAGGSSVNIFKFQGSPSSHVTINGGGGTFKQCKGIGSCGGGFDNTDSSWTLVDFSSMAAIDTWYGTSGANFRWSSGSWVSSGQLSLPQMQNTVATDRYIEYVDIRSPTASPLFRVIGNTSKFPAGRNEMYHCTVDSAAATATGLLVEVDASSFTFRNNVFRNAFIQEATTTGLDGNTRDNIFISTMAVAGCVQGTWQGSSVTISNNYFYTECDNPHNWQWNNSTRTVTYNVIEINTQGTQTDDGDVDLECPGCTISSGTIAYNLMIGKQESSEFLSMQGNVNLNNFTLMHHNTFWFDDTKSITKSCLRVGETYGGKTGMFPFIADNVCVSKSSDTAAHVETDLNIPAATDKVTVMDYNDTNFIGGTPYQSTKSVGSYGAHDVQANPLFVDYTRDLVSWDASLGGPGGSSSNAVTQLLQQNGYGGAANPAYNVYSLMSYVKGGFIPQNAALKGAGHDGSDIGAFPVQPLMGFFFLNTP